MAQVTGLDIGASGTKLAVFSGHGSKAVCQGFRCFDAEAEGILDENDMLMGMREEWKGSLSSLGPVTVGLASFQVTIKVADYPQVRERELSNMVKLEVLQLGGLSEESFVHGYLHQPSGWGRQHPVLLGMARESSVRERLQWLTQAGFQQADVQPAGLGLAAAAFDLIEGLKGRIDPCVLLDIGKETTTLVVVAGGQFLYLGSLMFGGEAFMAAGRELQKRHPSLSEAEPLTDFLRHADLQQELSQSPLVQAACALESEIQNALEHWRSQELETLAGTPIAQVYVTGGGSRLGGLMPWLQEVLECPVETFGPSWEKVSRPDLTLAYGLGLLASGKIPLRISLLPPDVVQLRLRKRRWPWLAAAAGLTLAAVLAIQIHGLLKNSSGTRNLKERKLHLESCVDQAGQLQAAQSQSLRQERVLQILAQDGKRGRILQRAMRLLGQGTLEQGWIIYLADGVTAYETRPFFQEQDAPSIFPAGQDRSSKSLLSSATATSPFVCAGYIPVGNALAIQRFMGHLSMRDARTSLFSNVDRGNTVVNTSAQLVWHWREYLNRHAADICRTMGLKSHDGIPFADEFELFTLNLPLKSNPPPDGTADTEEERR